MKFREKKPDLLTEIKQRVHNLRLAGGKPPPVVRRPCVSMKKLPKLRIVQPKKQLHSLAAPKEVSMPTTQLPEAPKVVEEKNKTPFSEEEYERLKQAFIDLDVDGGGDLTMKEVSRIPEIVGRKDLVIDRTLFKKMDKDRSGTVDFMEMLRCLYPTTPVQVIKAAVVKWAMPDAKKIGRKETKDDIKDWRRMYSKETLNELDRIFYLYGQEITPGVWGITKDSLRRQVNASSIGDDMIDELMAQHGQQLPRETTTIQPVVAASCVSEEDSSTASAASESPSSKFSHSVLSNETEAPTDADDDDQHKRRQRAALRKQSRKKKTDNDDDPDDEQTLDNIVDKKQRKLSKKTADDIDDDLKGAIQITAPEESAIPSKKKVRNKGKKSKEKDASDPTINDTDDQSQEDDDDGCDEPDEECDAVEEPASELVLNAHSNKEDIPPEVQSNITYITLDSFASIMELTYTTDENSSKAPQLYFQRKDGPAFPLSLPRV